MRSRAGHYLYSLSLSRDGPRPTSHLACPTSVRPHSMTFSESRCSSDAHIRSTLRSCPTRNACADDRPCMLCTESGLGLSLLLLSRRGSRSRASRAACSLCICKPGGLRWHSRMPTECPIWKINSVSHLSRASLTLVFTDAASGGGAGCRGAVAG